MYLEANIFSLGTAATDAWTAVYDKGKEKNFGTSKQDIDEYAAAGGGAAAGAVCAVYASAATALCAEGGAIVAGYVADTIQSIGAALFGGSGGEVWIDAYWNPVADKAVASVVKALRVQKGEDVSSPPGGTFRNYPEWHDVAAAWARNANASLLAQGSPLPKWFGDSPTDKVPGRITNDALTQWLNCMQMHAGCSAFHPEECGFSTNCQKIIDIGSGSSAMPRAIVEATQRTMTDVLSNSGSSSTGVRATSTAVKVGAVAVGAGLLWYFHVPIFAFLSRLVK